MILLGKIGLAWVQPCGGALRAGQSDRPAYEAAQSYLLAAWPVGAGQNCRCWQRWIWCWPEVIHQRRCCITHHGNPAYHHRQILASADARGRDGNLFHLARAAASKGRGVDPLTAQETFTGVGILAATAWVSPHELGLFRPFLVAERSGLSCSFFDTELTG